MPVIDLSAPAAVSVAELRYAGVDAAAIRRAVRASELLPLWHGTHLTRAGALDQRARWQATVALAPGCVLCGASAARLWEIEVPAEWPDEVAVPPSVTQLRSRTGLVVRARTIGPEEQTRVRGLPVTTLARLVVDVAADRSAADAQWVVDQALRRGLRPGEVVTRRGQRGAARVRRLLAAGEPLSESPLESALRIQLADLGRPVAQHVVRDNGRFVARLDLAWPAHRVAVEADGLRWHELPEPLLRDRVRQNALTAAGWQVLRGTWPDAHRPEALRAALAAVLRLSARD